MNVLDLFCGAGGFSAGIEQVDNVNIKCSIDNNNKAVEVYRENFNHTCLNKDIRNLELELVENVDWVHASPPCQDFSNINRNESKKRNELLYVTCERINEVSPEFFTIENVKGLLNMKDKNGNKYIKELKQKLSEYNIEVWNIDMSNYGIPQTRKRIIIFGTKTYLPNKFKPKKENKKKALEDIINTNEYKKQISSGNCTRQIKGKSPIRSVKKTSVHNFN